MGDRLSRQRNKADGARLGEGMMKVEIHLEDDKQGHKGYVLDSDK